MIAISTLVSEGGVIGLNGKRYVLDSDGDVMLFTDKEHAKRFVTEHGENPNDEYIDYEEYD
jgi:alpha-acetolactate decarboxylase